MAFLQKHNNNVVIKPDKPCSGKGVKVFGDHLFTKIDIIEYINELLANDKHLLIEEKIIGKEFSLHTITDGKTHKHLQAVQDFKRLLMETRVQIQEAWDVLLIKTAWYFYVKM